MQTLSGALISWVIKKRLNKCKNSNQIGNKSVTVELKHAGTADAWTPVIDAGTAVQRIRHAPWTTSVIEHALAG